MFRDSILVDAGWLDPARFGEVLARARSGLMSGASPVLRALSLEMWLRVQTGRWSELAPFIATTDAAVLAAAGDAVVA